jgi:ATP-dependent Clp protease adaptor protein ClpS
MTRFATKPGTDVEVLEIEDVETDHEKEWKIVVYNDDVNTFDHVIQALVDICNHTYEQAEQCALITHYKGKCAVKDGTFDELAPMRNALCERGISAEVE